MGTSTSTSTDTYMPREKDRPVHEVRIGAIKAAIWANETSNGTRYNVTFSRLYRDKEQDQWASTSSFGRDDLLLVAKVADAAHTWIFEQAHEKQEDPQT